MTKLSSYAIKCTAQYEYICAEEDKDHMIDLKLIMSELTHTGCNCKGSTPIPCSMCIAIECWHATCVAWSCTVLYVIDMTRASLVTTEDAEFNLSKQPHS